MDPLWLLSGKPTAPGWSKLQQDHEALKIDVLHLDRDRWALVHAPSAPVGYEGLDARVPPDGMYLDPFGRPCYVAGAREVHSARVVVRSIGKPAEDLLEKLGDAALVLERMGRAF